jgi:hypothetical protein
MPFIQSALGSGIGITDYRSSCAVNTGLKKDSKSSNDGQLRLYLQENAKEAKQKQLAYVPSTPYFDINGCIYTSNPTPGPSPY